MNSGPATPHPGDDAALDQAGYAELICASNFSFLRAASHVEELFLAARNQGHAVLGLCDHASLAGIVRAHRHAEEMGLRLIIGCRLTLREGASLCLYPQDRAAYAWLCALLTLGKRRAGKGGCDLGWDDLARTDPGQAHPGPEDSTPDGKGCENPTACAARIWAILIPPTMAQTTMSQNGAAQTGAAAEPAIPAADLARLQALFGPRASVALVRHFLPGDHARIAAIARAAAASGIATVAANDVLYHSPARRALHDVLTATREHCTVAELGLRRQPLAGRHLQSPAEMRRIFAAYPHALARSIEIARACRFSLRELQYQYPQETPLPGLSAQAALEQLTWAGATRRYGQAIPAKVAAQLRHELSLIGELAYAPYFLTVHSIVTFARSQHILCQGRGSAANSAVCYVLGITAIDPAESDLLFERFISPERREPPDIDVDFEHDRREEVIQWIYAHYGRDRAALCATVIRYRGRGAMRDVARAMGFAEDTVNALCAQISGWSGGLPGPEDLAAIGLDAQAPDLARALALAEELIDFPRHLSQHPGGFVLTQARLDSLVPIEPAAMADRQVIEWDKDDIDTLRFMKVDVLGLGMMGCLARCFDLLAAHKNLTLDLAAIPQNDAATYAMIRRADTVGVFQIESRAQMAMLPRLKPACFYDLVIEVAIVRPGPIQGDMVHPYLRRREGREAVSLPSEELRAVLGRTLGVPLFQEQAMKVAIVCAGFTPGEADQLRRSMATFKMTGGVAKFRDKIIAGMAARGYAADFAERTFKQIEGFGSYGFPESHAASFALLAYASAWLKCHHPEIFACALINAQPMGFYAPAQILRDAAAHGVTILLVSVNHSRWDCTLEPQARGRLALRLGLRLVRGLQDADAARLVLARADAPYQSVEDIWRRATLPRAAIAALAQADGFACLGLSRRDALWQARALADTDLPLFAAGETMAEAAIALPAMTPAQSVIADYRSLGLSLTAHPLHFLRASLTARRIIPAGHLPRLRDGARAQLAGLVLVRQKPASAKGVLFMTLEDESGEANIVVWPALYATHRRTILAARLLAVSGQVQKEGEVIHLIARDFSDLSAELDALAASPDAPVLPAGRGDEARRPVPNPTTPPPRERVAVRSRNFH